MAHLSLISGISSGRVEQIHRRTVEDDLRAERTFRRGVDVAEISQGAREAARADATPIRSELVQRIREEIQAGTYLTDDKLDAVADRILQRLDVQG